jgi:hypothetical protein
LLLFEWSSLINIVHNNNIHHPNQENINHHFFDQCRDFVDILDFKKSHRKVSAATSPIEKKRSNELAKNVILSIFLKKPLEYPVEILLKSLYINVD